MKLYNDDKTVNVATLMRILRELHEAEVARLKAEVSRLKTTRDKE